MEINEFNIKNAYLPFAKLFQGNVLGLGGHVIGCFGTRSSHAMHSPHGFCGFDDIMYSDAQAVAFVYYELQFSQIQSNEQPTCHIFEFRVCSTFQWRHATHGFQDDSAG